MHTKLIIGHARTKLLTYNELPTKYKKRVKAPGLFFIYKGEVYALDDFKKELGTLTCPKTLRRFNYDYICPPLALQDLDMYVSAASNLEQTIVRRLKQIIVRSPEQIIVRRRT